MPKESIFIHSSKLRYLECIGKITAIHPIPHTSDSLRRYGWVMAKVRVDDEIAEYIDKGLKTGFYASRDDLIRSVIYSIENGQRNCVPRCLHGLCEFFEHPA